jgi:hypothetical protein
MSAMTEDHFMQDTVIPTVNFADPPAGQRLALPSWQVLARFENPKARLPLRADFPPVFNMKISFDCGPWLGGPWLLDLVESELSKIGMSFQDARTIRVAYSHKDPAISRSHEFEVNQSMWTLLRTMSKGQSPLQFDPLDELQETRKLNRSCDQSAVHALARRQKYILNSANQDNAKFFRKPDGTPQIFIVLDHNIEQGSTYAEMISAITYNGGHVLAAVVGWDARDWVSNDSIHLRQDNQDQQELADTFAASARDCGQERSPEDCLKEFDSLIQTFGVSVGALTNGECERIIGTVDGSNPRGRAMTFPALCKTLQQTHASPAFR